MVGHYSLGDLYTVLPTSIPRGIFFSLHSFRGELFEGSVANIDLSIVAKSEVEEEIYGWNGTYVVLSSVYRILRTPESLRAKGADADY